MVVSVRAINAVIIQAEDFYTSFNVTTSICKMFALHQDGLTMKPSFCCTGAVCRVLKMSQQYKYNEDRIN